MSTRIVTYFGRIDHCSCIGLCIVTASSPARLVTSDQLQKKQNNYRCKTYSERQQKIDIKQKMWNNSRDFRHLKVFPLHFLKDISFAFKEKIHNQNSLSELIQFQIQYHLNGSLQVLLFKKMGFVISGNAWAVTQTVAPSVNYLNRPAPESIKCIAEYTIEHSVFVNT